MYLIINTADNEQITIILAASTADFYVKSLPAAKRQSEKLLSAISSLLAQKKITAKELKGIAVVSGPGGFTSLRIGIVCANTLAFALSIPVVGISKDEFASEKELVAQALVKLKKAKPGSIVRPIYASEPNITKSKKKSVMK